MTLRPGWPAVSGAATFLDIRQTRAGEFARSAAGVLRSGILPAHPNALVTAKATMAVDVAAFVAVIDRNGAVGVANDGTVAVTISAAPASGSRWSVVYVKQRESAAPMSDGADGPVLDKVESTSSEATARGLLPVGALELAVVQIPAGATATNSVGVVITQTHLYTASAGGTVLVRNVTERNAWTPGDGQLVHVLGTDQLFQYVDSTIGWLHIGGKPEIAAITPNTAGGISAGTPTPRVIGQAGRIALEGIMTASSGTYTAGTTYGIGVAGAIPAAFAPKVELRFAVSYNFVYFGELIVGTDGSLTWRPASTISAAPLISLVGSWPDKRLV